MCTPKGPGNNTHTLLYALVGVSIAILMLAMVGLTFFIVRRHRGKSKQKISKMLVHKSTNYHLFLKTKIWQNVCW
jgi:uncharacterized membrane protein YgaE (UPF0421/DUF939 family)